MSKILVMKTVNTYLFYQVCKVHEIVCFGDQTANVEKSCFIVLEREWF